MDHDASNQGRLLGRRTDTFLTAFQPSSRPNAGRQIEFHQIDRKTHKRVDVPVVSGDAIVRELGSGQPSSTAAWLGSTKLPSMPNALSGERDFAGRINRTASWPGPAGPNACTNPMPFWT
jgi:hypothetical protein